MKKVILFFLITILTFAACITIYAEDSNEATRMDAIKVIVGSIKKEMPKDLSALYTFSDCQGLTDEEKQTLAFAIENEIIIGFEDHTLRPTNKITRGDYAIMLYRASKFFENKPKLVDVKVKYPDIYDWDRNEINFCIERGIMMGYGNIFGTNEYLTNEQLRIIYRRLINGLETVEKYTFLTLNGASSINMIKVLNSVYDGTFPSSANYGKLTPQDRMSFINYSKSYVTTVYQYDYREMDTIEEVSNWYEKVDSFASYPHPVSPDSEHEMATLQYKVKEAEGKLYIEAFFVSDPQFFFETPNDRMRWPQEAWCYGYIYFILHSGVSISLPEKITGDELESYAVEPEKWYRQAVKVVDSHERNATSFTRAYAYKNYELVPKEILEW